MLCDKSLAKISFHNNWLAPLSRVFLPVLLLSACSSGLVSVKPTDLDALQVCQDVLQQQQMLLSSQQTSYNESLAALQDSLEEHRRQLAMIPPPPPQVVVPASECPKPPPPPPAETPSLDKQLVGERERVLINAVDLLMRARINTGVSLSQLDARDIQTFERNGEEWVRFNLVDRNTDKLHELERKRLRYVQTSKADESTRHPVVEMRITLGKLTQSAEFMLIDRSGQVYPLLIGRNVLRDLMLVDVSRSDLAPVPPELRKPPETGVTPTP